MSKMTLCIYYFLELLQKINVFYAIFEFIKILHNDVIMKHGFSAFFDYDVLISCCFQGIKSALVGEKRT